MPPPDSSQPSQLQAIIDQRIQQALSNPLSYPPQFVSWLTQFVSLYQQPASPPPLANSTVTTK